MGLPLPHKSKATSTPSIPVSAVYCEDNLHTRPRPLVSQYYSVVVTLTLSKKYQRPFLGLNDGHGGAVNSVLHLLLLLHHDLAQHDPVDQHVCAPGREDVEYRRGA